MSQGKIISCLSRLDIIHYGAFRTGIDGVGGSLDYWDCV